MNKSDNFRYFATLKKGESYAVGKLVFIKDKRLEVTEKIYEYLRNNRLFAVEALEVNAPLKNTGRPVGQIDQLGNGRITVYYPKTVDYDFMQQRPHHILRHLARGGFDVVYQDFDNKRPLRHIEPGFTVVSGNHRSKVSRPLVFYYTFPPHISYIQRLKPDLVVFDSIDEPVGEFSHWAEGYIESLKMADLVIASAKKLYDRAITYNDNVLLIPNSVDYDKFKVATKRVVPSILNGRLDGRPVIGFYGCLAGWLDLDLMVETMEKMPDCQFLIIGPNNIGIELPRNPTNLIRIPHVPYDTLPEILSTFDVGLIPFRASDIADSCSPLKLWEYLAGGKPVVVTNIKEANGLPGVLHADKTNMVETIRLALSSDNSKLVKKRQKVAEDNSWTVMCSKIGSVIREKLTPGTEAETMNIAIAYSPNWSTYVTLEVFNIFRNNKGPVKVFLLSDSLGRVNLDQVCQHFGEGYTYEFIDMEKIFKERIPSEINIESRYTKYTLYRLLLPELVNVNRLLYLDADTLVTGDLRPMYEMDLNDCLIAGSLDIGATPMLPKLGFGMSACYVNAGVLLMNLKGIRAEGIDKAWIEMVNKKLYTFHDQDIINLTCNNRVKVVGSEYNSSISTGHIKEPKVFHYAGVKPWVGDCLGKEAWDNTMRVYEECKLPKIPKRIHYCWFGKGKKPDIIANCLDSWARFAPDYEVIEWNESNFQIDQNEFVAEAYRTRKYAFITDYIRLWALYNYGGIYMDGDVELLKPIDNFLTHRAFTGHETPEILITAIMGAEPEHPWIKMLLKAYDNKVLDMEPNTKLITDLSRPIIKSQNKGLTILENDVHIYPVDIFCPYNHSKLTPTPTERSHAIHHFAGTWLGRTKV